MRIVHIVASLEPKHGGPSVSVPKIANAMAEFATEIQLLSTSPQGDTQHLDGPCPQHVFPRERPQAICPSSGLRHHLDRTEADILHSHGLWLRTLHYAHRRATSLTVPHVISPRGMLTPWARNQGRWKKWCAERIIHPRALEAARGWHATSPQEAEEIRSIGYRQPICVAPNGVEPPTADALQKAEAYWRAACPDAWTRPTALFYSRFHHKKRVLELIDIWVRQAPKDWLLLLVGIPQEYSIEQLRDYVIRSSGGGRILVYDGTETPPPYVAACLFLLPSHSENFGLVVAEALAHGLPVMVTDTTPWEAVNETDCGWCGPWVHFPEAMKAALDLGEATLRTRGLLAKEWVIHHYSWRKSAEKLFEFYKTLL